MNPKSRMMVFSGHAADFCSRSGGTILRYVRNGAAVKVICVTEGARGESPVAWRQNPGIDQEEVGRIRREEVAKACQFLGAEVQYMGYGDNPLTVTEERLEELTRIVRDFRPEIVLTHWHKDPCNPDHEALSRAVIQVCHYSELPGVLPEMTPLPRPPALFFFEPTVPTTPMTDFAPNVFIDITDVYEQKQAALGALRTQADLPQLYRLYGEYRGHQARVLAGLKDCRYAEAFVRFFPVGGMTFA